MDRHRLHRYIATFVGGATLFGLQQGLALELYFAIPAGIVAYIVTLVSLGLMFGPERAK